LQREVAALDQLERSERTNVHGVTVPRRIVASEIGVAKLAAEAKPLVPIATAETEIEPTVTTLVARRREREARAYLQPTSRPTSTGCEREEPSGRSA
jgi:hypothetical protein